jgi:hypothetical protein
MYFIRRKDGLHSGSRMASTAEDRNRDVISIVRVRSEKHDRLYIYKPMNEECLTRPERQDRPAEPAATVIRS